jgi:UDP-N-acetylglucosamine 2-epimerase (non-hydrolysing)
MKDLESLRPYKNVYFVIGTRAQFIKVAPLMRLILDRGETYKLIYTAQHIETIDGILETYNLPQPDEIIVKSSEANTRGRFIKWLLIASFKMIFQGKKYLPEKGIVLTHGDTFSTWLAAVMGKLCGCQIGHLESGLRSFNLFNPFPEELSRLVTFRFSDIYFCPNEWSMNNLKKYKGAKINMKNNPMYDGVKFAIDNGKVSDFDFYKEEFVLVSIHRYENIFKPRFEEIIIPKLIELSQKFNLVMTLHPTTRERLKAIGKYDLLAESILIHERFEFVDWINTCNKAEFVITDGGSNQEELSYLGTPTLIFRNETERNEGLDANIVLSKFDDEIIDKFTSNYKDYRRPFMELKESPSEVIFNYIYKK